jgi:hypothetical protein
MVVSAGVAKMGGGTGRERVGCWQQVSTSRATKNMLPAP